MGVGDARFLLGMGIERIVEAGTTLLTQEVHARAAPGKFVMVDARPVKTPGEAGPVCVTEEETLTQEDTTYVLHACHGFPTIQQVHKGRHHPLGHGADQSMSKPGP